MTTRRPRTGWIAALATGTAVAAVATLLTVPGRVEAASAADQLAPRASEQRWLDLRTMPAVAGASFELDGSTYTTGADGTVSIPAFGLTGMAERLHFVGTAPHPDGRADFVRFAFPPQEGYRRPAVAVFALQHAVQFDFLDPSGAPVSADRLTSMTIRSATGEQRTLTGADLVGPVLLPSTDVSSDGGVLEARDLRYTVQDVMVDGTSTVNRGQQDFYPARISELDVSTLFFDVHVSARDGIFGGATGDAVRVRRPDGTELSVPLVDGEADLPLLPRGDYQLRVEGSGWRSWQPSSVTRDQVVQLRVVTGLDLAVGGVTVLLVVTGLILVGRHRRRRRARRWAGRVDEAVREEVPTAAEGSARSPEPVP